MKKFVSILLLICISLSLCMAAGTKAAAAEPVLPEFVTFAELLNMQKEEITRATISNEREKKYVELTQEEWEIYYEKYKKLKFLLVSTNDPCENEDCYLNFYQGDRRISVGRWPGTPVGKFGGRNLYYRPYTFAAASVLAGFSYDYEAADDKEALPGEMYVKEGTEQFLTLPDGWAREDVADAADLGLFPPVCLGDYGASTTRLEFCKFAISLIEQVTGYDVPMYSCIEQYMEENHIPVDSGIFSDCGDAKEPAILAALGIVSGRSEGVFDPEGMITREEAAKMLALTAQVLEKTLPDGTETQTAADSGSRSGHDGSKKTVQNTLPYEDEDEIASWAKEPVSWCYREGVMRGITETEFAPRGNYTREQTIVTILRVYKLYVKG